jgi:hypothetical protein
MKESRADESFTEARSFHAPMTSAGEHSHGGVSLEHVIEGQTMSRGAMLHVLSYVDVDEFLELLHVPS